MEDRLETVRLHFLEYIVLADFWQGWFFFFYARPWMYECTGVRTFVCMRS